MRLGRWPAFFFAKIMAHWMRVNPSLTKSFPEEIALEATLSTLCQRRLWEHWRVEERRMRTKSEWAWHKWRLTHTPHLHSLSTEFPTPWRIQTWVSYQSPKSTLLCLVILYGFLTLSMPRCQYQYEIQNLHPFPKAGVMLENLGVSFAWGIPRPSKSRSKISNLIWNASEECRQKLSYKEKEVQNLWPRNHTQCKVSFTKPSWATSTIPKRERLENDSKAWQ